MLVLLALAAEVLSSGAASQPAIVEVEIIAKEPPHCLLPDGLPCSVGHDAGSEPEPGDDTFYVHPSIAEVGVTANPGVGPGLGAGADLKETSVEHGLGPAAAHGLDEFHSVYPDEAAHWVDAGVDEQGFWDKEPTFHPDKGVYPNKVGFAWPDEFVNYTHLHAPYTTYEHSLIDYWLDDPVVCPVKLDLATPACLFIGYQNTILTLQETVPNVVVGAEVGRVEGGLNTPTEEVPGASVVPPRGPSVLVASDERHVPSAAPPFVPHAERGAGGGVETDRAADGRSSSDSSLAAASGLVASRNEREGSWLPWAAASAAGLVVAGLAAALFHRIRRDRALSNETRKRIHEAIRASPGVRVGTLSRSLHVDYNTVRHHVEILRALHLVEAVGEGQRRYFVNGGTFGAVEKARTLAASWRSARAILDHVRAHGETEFGALAASTGFRASTLSAAASRLQAVGLVRKERRQGRLYLSLPAGAREPRVPGRTA